MRHHKSPLELAREIQRKHLQRMRDEHDEGTTHGKHDCPVFDRGKMPTTFEVGGRAWREHYPRDDD
jgi:hypothetical protein